MHKSSWNLAPICNFWLKICVKKWFFQNSIGSRHPSQDSSCFGKNKLVKTYGVPHDRATPTKSDFLYVPFMVDNVGKKDFSKTRLLPLAPAKTWKPRVFGILPTVTSQKKKSCWCDVVWCFSHPGVFFLYVEWGNRFLVKVWLESVLVTVHGAESEWGRVG